MGSGDQHMFNYQKDSPGRNKIFPCEAGDGIAEIEPLSTLASISKYKMIIND